MTEEQKQYIEENIDLIDAGDWAKFFKNSPRCIGVVLHEAGIDFMSELGYIPRLAFSKSNIETIDIPDGVTEISEHAFSYCHNLKSIHIPDSVTSIGKDAFLHCSNLTSITIPDNVTELSDNAFCNCFKLTSITIGNNVSKIGHEVFDGCSNLTSITLPNSVTSIGEAAFYNCTSLTNITIPNSVTHIGENAFYRIDELTISYGGTTAEWKSLIKNNSRVFKYTTYICNCVDGVVKKLK